MEISLHSNQKHIALGYYLAIIKDLINSQKNPFKILYYVDLYCGDGTCKVKKTKEDYSPPIIDSILKPAKDGKFSVRCFLNDLNQIDKMKENTKDYSNFIKHYSGRDANTCCKDILQMIPKDQFCIFFLDPTNHKDLKWSTIQEISEHTHIYHRDKIRRPELIINLMTYTMSGSYMAKSYKSVNESLGTDNWIKLIDKYKKEKIGTPVEKALLDTFVKQLEGIGYKVPTPIKILNTSPPNTVYYLVWATNEKGYQIIEKKVIPYLNKRIKKAHKENEKKLKVFKAKEKGESDLNKWID